MKIQLAFTIALGLGVIPIKGIASNIIGFEGFKWGDSRTEIMSVLGRPTYLFDKSIYYSDLEDQKQISGYKITSINFYFKPGCSELKESLTKPCELWAGVYRIESSSAQDFDSLSETLSKKYGVYKTKKYVETDFDSGEVNAQQTLTYFDYIQADGSYISLGKRELDKGYVEEYTNRKVEAGVQNITISYLSADYALNEKRKEQSVDEF